MCFFYYKERVNNSEQNNIENLEIWETWNIGKLNILGNGHMNKTWGTKTGKSKK